MKSFKNLDKLVRMLCTCSLLLFLGVSVVAQASTYDFSYSGRLVDDTGKPFDGPLALKVSFFHSSTGSTPVMEITAGLSNVALRDGVFQITMSLDAQDYQTIFPAVTQAVYLQITDVTHGKSYDRQQVSMLPYAGKVPVDSGVFAFNNDGEMTFSSAPQTGKYLKGNADGSVSWDTPAGGVAAASADTFTNKTINADNNTITNIADTNIKAGAAIADSKLATISTAGKVSGSAVTSGTIAGSTAVSTSGDISTTGKIGVGAAAGASTLEVTGSGTTSATAALNVKNSTPTSLLYVRNDGNVGIGTASPDATLELGGSNTPKLLLRATNSNSGYLQLNSTTFDLVSGVSPGSFRFMSVSDTTFPVLNLNTSLGGNHDVLTLNNYLGSLKNLVVKAHASQTANITEWQNSAGTAMSVIDSTGRIGIGATSPTANLHVTNAAGGVIARFTGSSANLTLSESSGNYSLLNSSSSAGFTFYASNNINATGGVLNATVGMTVGANPYTNTSLLVTGKDSTSATAGLNVQNSSSTSLLYARSDGNVGIGTTTPGSKLQVAGDITPEVDSTRSVGSAALRYGTVYTRGVNSGVNTLSVSGGAMLFNVAGTDRVRIVEGLRVGSAYVNIAAPTDGAIISGNVGIGNSSPSQKLSVGESGDGSVAIANSWTTYSDKRLKKDVSVIDNALSKISKLAGYFFYWKKGDDASRQVGVMAQDVEEIFPEVVKTGSDGIKAVDYPKLVAPMIEAIKALKNQNEYLKTQNEDLKTRTKSLEDDNRSLKNDSVIIKKYICDRDPDTEICN